LLIWELGVSTQVQSPDKLYKEKTGKRIKIP
jgi:hypothetical protein